MKTLKIKFLFVALLPFMVSCTTLKPVQITPPLSAITGDGITKKPITVGYIPPSVNKEETMAKKSYFYYGLSSTVVLSPYRDSTPIFRKVLTNVYEKAVPTNDKDTAFTSNADIKYLISITDIRTTTDDPTFDFGIMAIGNDHSQNYSIAFSCNIVDRQNKLVWKKEIVGTGHASVKEVYQLGGSDSLAPARALLSAFQSLQRELIKLEL